MRRNLLYIFLIVAVAATALAGCRNRRGNAPKTSVGEPYELFVICDDTAWENHIKEAVKETLECYVPGLSRPEKYFHVVDHADMDSVNEVERMHSNILAIRIDPTFSTPVMTESQDVNATAQLVITINAASAIEAAQFIYANGWDIREKFEHNERLIHFRTLTATKSEMPIEIIKNLTGIEMHVPGGFFVAKPKEDVLEWFVRKYDNKQQHIFVFTDPCEDINAVSKEQLIALVDSHIGVISVKDEEGSYMCISQNKESLIEARDINGRVWYELRCGWRVEGYTMGGPMVSYTTYDDANKRLITIAFALFSPEQHQRHDMAQLESLIYLTK